MLGTSARALLRYLDKTTHYFLLDEEELRPLEVEVQLGGEDGQRERLLLNACKCVPQKVLSKQLPSLKV